MFREIYKVICKCGASVNQVEPNALEEDNFGCSRKGCCVRAFQCPICDARFTFALEAPDHD